MTDVPTTLDRQFRDAAAAAGLLDVSYDIADTPVGPLLVAVTDQGLCRISYDPEPDRETEQLARTFGSRVLRAPRPLDPVKRELDEYFEGGRQTFDLPIDLRGRSEFTRLVLDQLARGSVRRGDDLRIARRPHGTAAGRASRRDDHEPQPDPDRPPCHRVVGSTGSLVGYGGGLERKRLLLDLEHAPV